MSQTPEVSHFQFIHEPIRRKIEKIESTKEQSVLLIRNVAMQPTGKDIDY